MGLLATGRLSPNDGDESIGRRCLRRAAASAAVSRFGVMNHAEQVAAGVAVLPVAGVVVGEEHHAGRDGAEAGQADVVDDDDRRVARPFDRQRDRQL